MDRKRIGVRPLVDNEKEDKLMHKKKQQNSQEHTGLLLLLLLVRLEVDAAVPSAAAVPPLPLLHVRSKE
ncbi:hypothetical protein DY000_02024922 [Brassica cretica]|uniref:Uncharacterized protein n=1 Tax=Brassica cretica TaxID=69181 RepID=A0ABQ7EJP7_BRACR|nr:hypothetical protein DY000_02024922 [Brassica cretica]